MSLLGPGEPGLESWQQFLHLQRSDLQLLKPADGGLGHTDLVCSAAGVESLAHLSLGQSQVDPGSLELCSKPLDLVQINTLHHLG